MNDDLLDRCRQYCIGRDYENLVATCDEILKTDRDNEKALGYKINALMSLERDSQALKCLDFAVKSHPDNFRFHFLRGETLLLGFDDYEGAIDNYEKGFALVKDIEKYWYDRDNLISALDRKAESLIELGDYEGAIAFYDRILYYDISEFGVMDKIDSIVDEHDVAWKSSPGYSKSQNLRKRARKRAEAIDDCLKKIEIGEYDADYIRGCSEFRDYTSFGEYLRDLIIYLMEAYPCRSEETARHLVKCNMEYVKTSYESGEPVAYCSIEVGYCCG